MGQRDLTLTDVRRVLDSNPWFEAIPAVVKDAIFCRATVRAIKKGAVLTLQETVNDAMHAIVEGEVHILRHRPDGEEALIHVAGPGYWLGEVSLIRRDVAVVTCIAQTDGHVLVLTRDAFEEVVREQPAFWRHLAILTSERLAGIIAYLADTRDLTPEMRLCSRLAEIAAERAHDTGHPPHEPVALPFSQSSLARMVGISRQTLNLLLSVLDRAGLITVSFRRITVNDVRGLRARAAAIGNATAATHVPLSRSRVAMSRR